MSGWLSTLFERVAKEESNVMFLSSLGCANPMSFNSASVIRRHMKRSPNFVPCADIAQMPVQVRVEPGETPVGWLPNPPPWQDSIVLFFSTAIYSVEAGRVTRIGLDTIVDYEAPGDKLEATGVRVQADFGVHFVRMAGRYGAGGKYGDLFHFRMILQTLVARNRAVR